MTPEVYKVYIDNVFREIEKRGLQFMLEGSDRREYLKWKRNKKEAQKSTPEIGQSQERQ